MNSSAGLLLHVLPLFRFDFIPPHRIRTDLDAPKGSHLMGPNEEGSLNIITLLLAGRATPYLHNGVVYVGDEDHYVIIAIATISGEMCPFSSPFLSSLPLLLI